jgi:hypothetical protein
MDAKQLDRLVELFVAAVVSAFLLAILSSQEQKE